MPCACVSSQPSRTANVEDGTWKPVWSRKKHVWTVCCWHSNCAMWWVSHLAASCMHHGKRDRFDRTDRRDKGIFRLGRLWLLDILRRTSNRADLVHCLPFRKLATGWHFSMRF